MSIKLAEALLVNQLRCSSSFAVSTSRRGTVKRIEDAILKGRGGTDPTAFYATKTKLILKGLNPDRFTAETPDDAALVEKARKAALEMDRTGHVGLLLVDELCRREEQLMDALGNLSDVSIVGGSAGDDLLFRTTELYANGAARSGGAMLVLRLNAGFHIVKTQSFRSTAFGAHQGRGIIPHCHRVR